MKNIFLLLALFAAIASPGAVAQLATDCTLYAAPMPAGNDSNKGTTPSRPKTFKGAANATVPGSVVCVKGGTYTIGGAGATSGVTSTFSPPNSGTSSGWIVYKAYGDSSPIFNWNGCNVAGCSMFRLGSERDVPNGPHYIEFNGLTLDGKERATNGFSMGGAHHLRFIGNSIKNTGGAGIGGINNDYVVADHNLIWHNGSNVDGNNPGYAPCCGWSSGISYNSAQWFDTYDGIHNFITNNIISGEVDGSTHHTDGNGIILDLSCRSGCGTLATANTPPVLIMNNVVYNNGGRCIEALNVSNFYIINNSCYKNGLDRAAIVHPAEYLTRNSTTGWFVNNIAVAWANSGAYSFKQDGSNNAIAYYKDMWLNGGLNFIPPDPTQFFNQDPLYLGPPAINACCQDGQYANALNPALLGADLTLQSTSAALQKGIDPSTISGLRRNVVNDLRLYIYKDINGVSRAIGTWDLGAQRIGLHHDIK